MKLQTQPNILTTLSISFSGFNVERSRWEITYSIDETNLIGGKTSRVVDRRTISIVDTPETPILDDEGNETGTNPADPAMSDFVASWSTIPELTDASFARVIEREGIEEWDGSIIDDIENDPDATNAVEWSTLIGQLVAPPNKVINDEIVYDVLIPHRVQAQFPPPIATLYSVSPDQPGGERPAWEQGTFALDVEVTHADKIWKNRRDNNNQGFAPGTTGSGWMEIQDNGDLHGEYYNLGNEGYPVGYIAIGSPCYLNDTANNTFAPGVFGWSETTCP